MNVQEVQVPKGFIEKPVQFRYGPATVIGSLKTSCHWINGASGKAFWDADLKSGELLVWIYKMILTVDRKHHNIILFCKSDDRILTGYGRFLQTKLTNILPL